jgi:hypothetical protein
MRAGGTQASAENQTRAVSMRVKGVYRGQKVELELPLPLADGAEVELEIHPVNPAASEEEEEAWRALGMARLEEEWDNPQDAVYDDWRTLYGG